jgi:transcriptional regulator with XRE-family HTH domain
MKFQDKLQELRKMNKLSQEELAEQIGITRQAVAKWESGQAYPDITNLIRLSEVFKITIDRMVKEEDNCSLQWGNAMQNSAGKLVRFLLTAKKHTYAAKENRCTPSRVNSIDYCYQEGEYLYLDTYLGGECFSGEEAVWYQEVPRWAMNYSGRVLNENFDGDFLKEALLLTSEDKPYRGPGCFIKGDFSYHCKVEGDFDWYQGYEDIFYLDKKIYECYFHGGV